MRTSLLLPALLALAAVVPAGTALADHPQPAFDGAKMDYAPIGRFKPGDPVPPADPPLQPTAGRRFNPSGKYNAFDTNLFETISLPFREAGDKSDKDPLGNGGNPKHGLCKPNPAPRPGPEAPLSSVAGECPNHQLEYGLYFEETMRDILGDFGVSIRRYRFENPGSGNTQAGQGINVAAVVPGADHPEDTIVVGAHYDQTTEGPASAWDSAEGHAQLIRIAKIMADYWRATGTRPSATVKFIPWDGEESGTLGSLDYATNNIVPGEESKVRGYFNTDPCAGGYPAFRYGNPNDRVNLGIQLADEKTVTQYPTSRITAFNKLAPQWVEQVFDRLDDELTLDAGKREIFISTSEAKAAGTTSDIGTEVIVGKGRPVLFSSDWRNFEVLGIPFFNPGPEVTGPDSENNPNNPDALAILHTPNDNQNTLNAYTGRGPSQASGTTLSEGWMKGMEMCAQLLAQGMLQPQMGGGQTTDGNVVAYYEALPNEALQNQAVRFDATGSYQYADAAARRTVPADQLEYRWDFGDGTTGTGREVSHPYAAIGVYRSTLTVRNVATGQSDTMTVPITVVGSNFAAPVLTKPAAEDQDGTFPLSWTFTATRAGFERFLIEEATDYRVAFADDAEGPIGNRWTVDKPTHPDMSPWQASDSSTRKVRGTPAAEGKRSYWTGFAPESIKPAGAVQQGISQMTVKEPFHVPEGSATLSFASIYQMEGDDRGVVEIATTDAPNSFEQVAALFPTATALGEQDPKTCDPSNPKTYQQPFERQSFDIGQYAGKDIIVRFKLVSGPENRVLSQPCGWYVDDLRVAGGTFTAIGESLEKTFEVRNRAKGTYAYRVRGVYADGVRTAASNVELVTVTTGAPADRVGDQSVGGSGAGAPSCQPSAGFESVSVRPVAKRRKLRFDFARRTLGPVRVDVFQESEGQRRLLRSRRVAQIHAGDRAVTWTPRDRRRKEALTDGYYFARFHIEQEEARSDVRRVTLRRKHGRFYLGKPFYGPVICGLLSSAKLRSPVFGGRQGRALVISFTTTSPATVRATVFQGKRRAFRTRAYRRPANRTKYVVVPVRKLRGGRGLYRVRVVARAGERRGRVTVYSRRL